MFGKEQASIATNTLAFRAGIAAIAGIAHCAIESRDEIHQQRVAIELIGDVIDNRHARNARSLGRAQAVFVLREQDCRNIARCTGAYAALVIQETRNAANRAIVPIVDRLIAFTRHICTHVVLVVEDEKVLRRHLGWASSCFSSSCCY